MDVAQVKAAEQRGAAEPLAPSNRSGQTGPGTSRADDGGPATDLARALAGEEAGSEPGPSELRLKVDRELDQVVATVVDPKSERVLRTIPPEELLEAAKRLQAALGQILNREV